jgi:Predicted pyridoxal phosphate-dependent enzyme apparently involved in regulation of cell wall biogenesis
MIVTNDDNLATICRALRAHGSGENGKNAQRIINNEEIKEINEENSIDNTVYNPSKYYNYLIGHNSRLDEIQASILRIKLRKLDEWNEKRINIAKNYSNELIESRIKVPYVLPNVKHVYHMYIIQSDNRDEMINYLNNKGISTGTYYPVPLHLQEAFKYLKYQKGDLPNAEYLSERTFAIPMFPELNNDEIDYIINAIKRFGEHNE